ncbi:MAG: hypothetical protein ACXVIY_06205 [Mucilaginibacter sp.]
MKKIFVSGIIAGFVLLIFCVIGLYAAQWLLPDLTRNYYTPVMNASAGRIIVYSMHPIITGLALSWFWSRFKQTLTGSFISRGIEFGLIYAIIAIIPMLWLVYSPLNASISMVTGWFLFWVFQGLIAGLVFEKTNP